MCRLLSSSREKTNIHSTCRIYQKAKPTVHLEVYNHVHGEMCRNARLCAELWLRAFQKALNSFFELHIHLFQKEKKKKHSSTSSTGHCQSSNLSDTVWQLLHSHTWWTNKQRRSLITSMKLTRFVVALNWHMQTCSQCTGSIEMTTNVYPALRRNAFWH